MSRFQKVTVKQRTLTNGKYRWKTYYVEGFTHLGERIRIQRKKKSEAYAIAQELDIKLLNSELDVRPLSTRLDRNQVKQAEHAFHRLQGRWTLDYAIDFFLKHHYDPREVITYEKAREQFLTFKTGQGIKLRSLKSVTGKFGSCLNTGTPIHHVSQDDIERFLVENIDNPKSWNNYRADLHNLFAFCIGKRWMKENPAANIPRKKVSRGRPDIIRADAAERMLRTLSRYRGGAYVRYFALALFAGIRPGEDGELSKLAVACLEDGSTHIDLDNDVIHIEPEISKTGEYRRVPIRANLKAWLLAYPGPIIPVNFHRKARIIRKHFKLTHDICRHTFISMNVAAYGSIGRAALEAGNSEQIIKRHYHQQVSEAEGKRFWEIMP